MDGYRLKMGNNKEATQEKKEAMLDTLMNKPKFYCLSRDFSADDIMFFQLDSTNEDDAWKEIEEGIATNGSQDWLLSRKNVRELIKMLKHFK